MPATPFHMGAALVIKPIADRHFSVITFGVAQIFMDIEPLIGIFRNSGTLHGVTHTFIGAIVIAILVAMISPCICRSILSRFNREAQFYKISWLSEPETVSCMVIYSSAYFGTLSHVIIDSFIYYDMHPFMPFSDLNPFLNIISPDGVYHCCFVLAVVGVIAWVVKKFLKFWLLIWILLVSLLSSPDLWSDEWSDIVETEDILELSSGKGVVIAIIDSGIDTANPIFVSALWQNNKEISIPLVENDGVEVENDGVKVENDGVKVENDGVKVENDGVDNDQNGYIDDINGWNFGDANHLITDVNGHGTNVAGIILKCAPESRLMILKINPGNSNTFYTDAVVDAIYYAVKSGADVINMSLSLSNESYAVKDAIKYAIKRGVMVVSAAGNSYSDVTFPGTMEEVITVGATIADGSAILWNSPAGTAIDITAPGKSIKTVGIGGNTIFVTGTSFSAPMVSGTIASIIGMNPSLKPETIQMFIFHGAKEIGNDGKDEQFGWGVLSGSGIKQLAIPSIIPTEISSKQISSKQVSSKNFEISCYLPPTDLYTDVYIALIKTQLNQQNELTQLNELTQQNQQTQQTKLKDEYIWWLDINGLWKSHNDYGIISIASLKLDNKGLNILLFSDLGGIWSTFSTSNFESGSYKLGIGLMKESRWLAPVFWSSTITVK